ncbi:MAG: helix-turn-helix transcriptional regulator [Pseudomonadota bacterium]
MIRVLLKKLLDEKSFSERRRITLNEVSKETGVSRPTLTRIANIPGYVTNTETIEALCRYFECQPGDMLQLVDGKPSKPGKRSKTK